MEGNLLLDGIHEEGRSQHDGDTGERLGVGAVQSSEHFERLPDRLKLVGLLTFQLRPDLFKCFLDIR